MRLRKEDGVTLCLEERYIVYEQLTGAILSTGIYGIKQNRHGLGCVVVVVNVSDKLCCCGLLLLLLCVDVCCV